MSRARKQNGHLWRTLQAKVKARDTHCHLCSQPIDKTLPPLHPWSFEIDHIIPYSKRPDLEYEITNLAGAHRECNRRKSNGPNKPIAIPQPTTNSQDWTQ